MMRLATLVFALTASSLSAECLTRADLKGDGIYLAFDDGYTINYRALEGDVIGEFNDMPADETDFFYGMYRGIYLLIDADIKDGEIVRSSLLTYQPSNEAAPLPEVSNGAKWQGEIIVSEEDGTYFGRMDQSITVSDTAPFLISGCEYQALKVMIEETYGNKGSAAEHRYLKDLGISMTVAYGSIGAPPTPIDAPLTLTAEPPN